MYLAGKGYGKGRDGYVQYNVGDGSTHVEGNPMYHSDVINKFKNKKGVKTIIVKEEFD